MPSRSVSADLRVFGLVALFLGACTYEAPTAISTGAASGGSAGSGGSGGMGGMGGASPCVAPSQECGGVCIDTSTDPMHCGNCMTPCEVGLSCEAGMCKQAQPCTPGTTKACYSGLPATEGIGPCRSGTQTCAADGLSWGPCMGQILPSTETCGNIVDEDCNGNFAAGLACLASPNLVARYFLDEAESGQPMTALDSAPDPLDLPVTYDSINVQPNYIVEGAGRGLEWGISDQNGVAMTPTKGTKIKNMLASKRKVTMEVVARIDAATVNHTRVFAIGAGTVNVLSLGVYSTPEYVANFNDVEVGLWSADFVGSGRTVFHVVIDTTDTNLSNRVRLYINGIPQLASGGTPPLLDEQLAFNDTESICLGNRDTQGRSFDGALYYAAIYADAMSEADIAKNAEVLAIWDDQ